MPLLLLVSMPLWHGMLESMPQVVSFEWRCTMGRSELGTQAGRPENGTNVFFHLE